MNLPMRKIAHGLGAGFQQLEDRTLPHTSFGIPWTDSGHLTLSFAPDGTATQIGGSSLHETLALAGTADAWQRELLRAFQTWAAHTNVNIGLVGDGGQPFGTPGAVQGDGRFGDVRVGAAPLSPGVVASAAPFSWTGTTFSGDLLFNSTKPFRIGDTPGTYDVFSIALHEAGHALGLDHSDAAGSVMNEAYAYRTGLSGGDIANIQAMYGARVPDRYDAAGGNDTVAQASAVSGTGLGSQRLWTDGDLTTLADVDYYKFTVLPTAGVAEVTVRLKAEGLSLLLPRVTVTNAAGQVVASDSSLDPQANDLTLRFTPSLFGGTYYVQVDGAIEDVFGIGEYELTVDGPPTTNAALTPVTSVLTPLLDLHLNDTLAAATHLLPVWGNNPPDRRFDYSYRGVIEDGTDTDYYHVRAPAASGSAPVNLNVLVWGLDASPLAPRVRAYDAEGNPVAFQVLANDAGLMSVQVLAVTPSADYYVQVFARAGAANGTGAYFFGADYNQFAPTTYAGLAAGTLGPEDQADNGNKLRVGVGGVFQFALSADLLGAGGGAVTMTVTDSSGNVVLNLTATAGQPPVTAVRYLAAGNYTVRYVYQSPAGSIPTPIRYGLFLLKLSDGVGPYATDVSSNPDPPPDGSGGSSDSGYSYSGSSNSPPDGYGYCF